MSDNTYNLLIKYYEIHVNHRRHMLNFLIISLGALSAAISFAVKSDYDIIASLLTALAIIIVFLFSKIDNITYNKIKESVRLLKNEDTVNKNTAIDLFCSSKTIMKDNEIIKVISIILLIFLYATLLYIALFIGDGVATLDTKCCEHLKQYINNNINTCPIKISLFFFILYAHIITEIVIILIKITRYINNKKPNDGKSKNNPKPNDEPEVF